VKEWFTTILWDSGRITKGGSLDGRFKSRPEFSFYLPSIYYGFHIGFIGGFIYSVYYEITNNIESVLTTVFFVALLIIIIVCQIFVARNLDNGAYFAFSLILWVIIVILLFVLMIFVKNSMLEFENSTEIRAMLFVVGIMSLPALLCTKRAVLYNKNAFPFVKLILALLFLAGVIFFLWLYNVGFYTHGGAEWAEIDGWSKQYILVPVYICGAISLAFFVSIIFGINNWRHSKFKLRNSKLHTEVKENETDIGWQEGKK